MKVIWLATALLISGIAAALALTPEQQIILFGGNSSATGGGAVACGTGVIDLSTGCSLPIALGLIP